jgi:hypothetical protein
MCVFRNHPHADIWPQDTAEPPAAVLATIATPESWAAMPLTGVTATDAEVIDGRPPCLHSARGERS